MSTSDEQNVDMDALERKTKQMGAAYADQYVGCAQSSFSTVVDVLRAEVGIEVVDEEVEEAIFTGKVGLSGGISSTGRGTCGAIEGSATAVSLAANVGREEQEKRGAEARMEAYDSVYRYVAKPALDEFGGLTCREVQWAKFDRAWNMAGPLPSAEDVDPIGFESFHENECEMCKDEDGHIMPQKCTIPHVAWWAVSGILEMEAASD